MVEVTIQDLRRLKKRKLELEIQILEAQLLKLTGSFEDIYLNKRTKTS